MTAFKINERVIGRGYPCYIIAEVSCNHEGDLNEAKNIIKVAAEVGCDAAKIQTYTPDTMTRDFKNKPKGTMWEDVDLHQLYEKAHTPWEWHVELKKIADDCGIDLFSSPFDESAVDFLEQQDVPAYKVASFEIVDTKLLEKIAATGKPVVMSSGMSTFMELKEAVDALQANGVSDLALLKCNSGYPGDFAEANLKTIPVMEEIFGCVTGLSDHIIFADSQIENCRQPLAHVAPLEGIRFGAKLLEVHLTLDRDKARALMEKNEGGFDWPFSRTPQEMKKMVDLIRAYEAGEDISYETVLEQEMAAKTHGEVMFDPTPKERGSRELRPSLWVVQDVKAGEPLQFASGGEGGNFDSIRPGGGMHIRFTDFVDGKFAERDIAAGTPLSWDMVNISGEPADTVRVKPT